MKQLTYGICLITDFNKMFEDIKNIMLFLFIKFAEIKPAKTVLRLLVPALRQVFHITEMKLST